MPAPPTLGNACRGTRSAARVGAAFFAEAQALLETPWAMAASMGAPPGVAPEPSTLALLGAALLALGTTVVAVKANRAPAKRSRLQSPRLGSGRFLDRAADHLGALPCV